MVLLIERLDDTADNREQRMGRKFYLKNGFTSSDIFISGTSGEMEIMNYGGRVSPADYMRLQKYALGTCFSSCSKIKKNDGECGSHWSGHPIREKDGRNEDRERGTFLAAVCIAVIAGGIWFCFGDKIALIEYVSEQLPE